LSFTDQEPRCATEEDLKGNWGGYKNGKGFRCYLCGYKFKKDYYWRWVYSPKSMNFITCEECDGEDVLERWKQAQEELGTRFWWMMEMYKEACYQH
jgi:hypothetical protein